MKRDGSFSFAEFAIGMIGSKKEKDVIKPKLDNELLEKTPRGVIFGKEQRGYIAKSEDKDGHILVIGGAGSGKSSSIAIPSLISWKERVFAIDIKGELIKKTGHKRTLTKVFNPNDPESYGYDPFYLISSCYYSITTEYKRPLLDYSSTKLFYRGVNLFL